MVNRKFFFDYVRVHLFAGKMKPSQVDGMEFILHHWDGSGWLDTRWLAYMLATTYHETRATMQPIPEDGKGKGREYGKLYAKVGPRSKQYVKNNNIYYGRGLVQITWQENYAKFEKLTGQELVRNPDLALDATTSIMIMFAGMAKGLFTGKKLSDYFQGEKTDWVGARKIINGTDRAQQIAVHAKHFYAAINILPNESQ